MFDAEQKLAYRGQLDDSRPSNKLPIDGRDVRAALDAVLASETQDARQIPGIGCSIKWITGNEPEYS